MSRIVVIVFFGFLFACFLPNRSVGGFSGTKWPGGKRKVHVSKMYTKRKDLSKCWQKIYKIYFRVS